MEYDKLKPAVIGGTESPTSRPNFTVKAYGRNPSTKYYAWAAESYEIETLTGELSFVEVGGSHFAQRLVQAYLFSVVENAVGVTIENRRLLTEEELTLKPIAGVAGINEAYGTDRQGMAIKFEGGRSMPIKPGWGFISSKIGDDGRPICFGKIIGAKLPRSSREDCAAYFLPGNLQTLNAVFDDGNELFEHSVARGPSPKPGFWIVVIEKAGPLLVLGAEPHGTIKVDMTCGEG